MESNTHRLTDIIEQVWPYISGMCIVMFAAAKLLWHDRQVTKKRIAVLEILAEHTITKEELHSCRNDVRTAAEANLNKIYAEIKENTSQNAQQHQDMMAEIIKLSSKEN